MPYTLEIGQRHDGAITWAVVSEHATYADALSELRRHRYDDALSSDKHRSNRAVFRVRQAR